MRISDHFTLEELLRSDTANARGIQNEPTAVHLYNLVYFVRDVLEPLRIVWGGPIIVTSGYRCPELNKAVGGVANSAHTKGCAVDIVPLNVADLNKLYKVAAEYCDYDQLIFEKDNKGNQWIHLGIKENPAHNRHQAI